MPKKTKLSTYAFERSDTKKLSSVLYDSMLSSKAFMTLTPRAKVLYLYMKLQLYGQKPVDNDATVFYFNRALYVGKYELYTKWKDFDADKRQLIDHGFIDEIENGANSRTKNKYKFSGRWMEYR